jgi:hypothetical protein
MDRRRLPVGLSTAIDAALGQDGPTAIRQDAHPFGRNGQAHVRRATRSVNSAAYHPLRVPLRVRQQGDNLLPGFHLDAPGLDQAHARVRMAGSFALSDEGVP